MVCLEGKDLVLQLADRTGLVVAERFGGLLETTNHGGRATDQDLDVVRGLWQPLLQTSGQRHLHHGDRRVERMTYSDHVASNVANTARPVLRWVVKDVVNANVGILVGESVKILLEQNVLSGDIGEDEVNLCPVTSSATTHNGADDLKHGGDTGTTSDHAKVADHVGLVDEGTLRALDTNSLANNQGGHVLGDVALGVALDQEIKVAGLMISGDGSVGAHDLLGLAVLLRKESAN